MQKLLAGHGLEARTFVPRFHPQTMNTTPEAVLQVMQLVVLAQQVLGERCNEFLSRVKFGFLLFGIQIIIQPCLHFWVLEAQGHVSLTVPNVTRNALSLISIGRFLVAAVGSLA